MTARIHSLAALAMASISALSCQAQVNYTITVKLDVQKSISPYVYGANFPDWKAIGLSFPAVRQGGNRMTAYNWENNASNAGNDYFHQNDNYLGETSEPGWNIRTFLEESQAHKAAVLLTIPMAGYVAADKAPAGDVNKTPNYLEKRFVKTAARKGAAFVYPPNTQDKVVYEDELVHFLETKKKSISPVWYALDNEPDLWGSTHARIWPTAPTYAGILSRSIEYASAIKDVAPKSLIFGPCSYGYNGYRTFQNATDQNGRDFLDFYLAGMKQAEIKAKKRILDVLDLHWYPEAQGGGVRICFGEDKPGTPAARIQAPRSLWDPTYVEKSWITDSNGHKPIAIIPDTYKRIQANYPGTKLAFTEYDFGGGKVISGALAEADVLGIFGRYGIFMASHWVPSAENFAIIAGFRAFMNYDAKGSRFGDVGLGVSGEKASDNSVYASLDSKKPGKLTLVVINKTNAPQTYQIRIPGFQAKSATGYLIDSGNLKTSRKTQVSATGNSVLAKLPAESILTVEVANR